MEKEKLQELAKLVRYYILRMTTKAGSGHATSALSAADLMVALFFEKLRFDLKEPENPNNDRVIFSKGHASPLIYALYAAAGILTEKDLDTYRQFGSPLEGHPTPRFKYVEVATGSLGQGLSIGLGMALALRANIKYQISNRARFLTKSKNREERNLRELPKVYVLMGDSEMSEGSVWEAIQLASYYGVNNLVGIIDVNRLGQRGETMLGWDVDSYQRRIAAFGWGTHVCDGHNLSQILAVFDEVSKRNDGPQMVIAKTIKGCGISFLENKEGWHGRALTQEDFAKAVKELGVIDRMARGEIARPVSSKHVFFQKSKYQVLRKNTKYKILNTKYKLGEMVATRKAYGETITKLGEIDSRIVALDGEVSNSTFAQIFKERHPERFFEMFIAEQNMVGVALGMSKRGYVPFVSTFAAFFTRAFDQVRMSGYSRANVKFVGSHAGVSIGEDGPSQMGLEDIAMFRTIQGGVVLCPADAASCAKLVAAMAEHEGICYMRSARPPTPVIYENNEEFKIGGSKVVRSSAQDRLTIVACGVCVVEAINASGELEKQGINVRVIDAYSIKPIDEATLGKSASETNNLVLTVEDHYFEGGLGDAVLSVFAREGEVLVHKLAVWRMPMSGKPGELLDYEGISAGKIVVSVQEILGKSSKK